ncbi:MAG: hypothetical protein RSJ40_10515 [Acetivibrio sp.]
MKYYDVILVRNCSRPDVCVFYDEDREKAIKEMGKYVEKHGFPLMIKMGLFLFRMWFLENGNRPGKK